MIEDREEWRCMRFYRHAMIVCPSLCLTPFLLSLPFLLQKLWLSLSPTPRPCPYKECFVLLFDLPTDVEFYNLPLLKTQTLGTRSPLQLMWDLTIYLLSWPSVFARTRSPLQLWCSTLIVGRYKNCIRARHQRMCQPSHCSSKEVDTRWCASKDAGPKWG